MEHAKLSQMCVLHMQSLHASNYSSCGVKISYSSRSSAPVLLITDPINIKGIPTARDRSIPNLIICGRSQKAPLAYKVK